MSDEEKRQEEAAETAAEQAAEEETAAGESAEEAVENEQAADDETEVDALKRQVGEFQDQMLRTQAEMQNVRRRAEIDVEKARKFAVEKFVKELLPVADSLEKAVESAQEKEAADDVVASIREGAEMTLNLFLTSIEKFNVKQLDPVGEPFDPQYHEAMSMVPAPDAEPNSVVTVVQKGYTLHDRVVRPAMVMVAKPEDSAKIDEQA
ncbi:molecular chaperone GrpE [Tamilnaduibacter salinus]|uniref:Protein GrpE n=1 Tax=Tamilnaduibacter salinus TaxID=1484056 RepID=A0A2U1CWD7_9GAMM|nr:nucleotide exchange factor GrpE [Tamilnaduibacter salinus]PVY75958.1 molecular chaperone GrpE [Tamilnaduibacter salinus]